MNPMRRGVTRIALDGDLGPETAEPLVKAVDAALRRDPGRLELNMQQAQISDGAALFVLIDLHRRAHARRCELTLTKVPPPMRMIFDGTLLPALIPIEGVSV